MSLSSNYSVTSLVSQPTCYWKVRWGHSLTFFSASPEHCRAVCKTKANYTMLYYSELYDKDKESELVIP